jgi:hypothetical protein
VFCLLPPRAFAPLPHRAPAPPPPQSAPAVPFLHAPPVHPRLAPRPGQPRAWKSVVPRQPNQPAPAPSNPTPSPPGNPHLGAASPATPPPAPRRPYQPRVVTLPCPRRAPACAHTLARPLPAHVPTPTNFACPSSLARDCPLAREMLPPTVPVIPPQSPLFSSMGRKGRWWSE